VETLSSNAKEPSTFIFRIILPIFVLDKISHKRNTCNTFLFISKESTFPIPFKDIYDPFSRDNLDFFFRSYSHAGLRRSTHARLVMFEKNRIVVRIICRSVGCRTFFQVLNNRELILVIEGVGYIIDDKESFFARFSAEIMSNII